jgi:hypothetical protein
VYDDCHIPHDDRSRLPTPNESQISRRINKITGRTSGPTGGKPAWYAVKLYFDCPPLPGVGLFLSSFVPLVCSLFLSIASFWTFFSSPIALRVVVLRFDWRRAGKLRLVAMRRLLFLDIGAAIIRIPLSFASRLPYSVVIVDGKTLFVVAVIVIAGITAATTVRGSAVTAG